MADITADPIEAQVESPVGVGFAFSPTRYWEAGEDVVLAEGGPLGTRVRWRHTLQRFDFTIYNRTVATLEATSPAIGSDLFYTNGLLDVLGRVTEASVQSWEDRIQQQPIEFDSLAGAWCIATYPGAHTALWIYSNGNVRCRAVIETGYVQPREAGLPYTGLEQLLHLDDDGIIYVTRLSEQVIVYPVALVSPLPRGAGQGLKSTLATGDVASPLAVSDASGVRTTATGSVEGVVSVPLADSGLAIRAIPVDGIEATVAVPVADPISALREAIVNPIEGVVNAPQAEESAAVRVVDAIVGALTVTEPVADSGRARRIAQASGDDIISVIPIGVGTGTRIFIVSATVDSPLPDGINLGAARVAVAPITGVAVLATAAGDGLRTATASAIIISPLASVVGEGLRTGTVLAIPVVSPLATAYASTGLRSTNASGTAVSPLPEVGARADNPERERYSLYRVTSVTRHPMAAYQTVTLEMIERPFDA